MAKKNKVRSMFFSLGKITDGDDIPSSSCAMPKTMGAYIIEHTMSGKIFIGVSNNIYQYNNNHISYLNRNVHANAQLQEAFNQNSGVSLMCIITDSMDEAYEIKQRVLDEFHNSGLLFNIALDAGYNKRARKVMVDGVEYASIGIVSIAKNICHSAVRGRIASKKFPTWVHKTE